MKNLQEENRRLEAWIDDLQSGMYINCVYCGHRYGPNSGPNTKDFNITMRKALEDHISKCHKHPLSEAKAANARLQAEANWNMKEPCEAKAEIDQHREKIAVLIGCRDHWKHSYDSARAEIAKMDSDIIFLGTVVEGLQAQNSALKEENTKLKEYSVIDHKTIHTQRKRIKELEGALMKFGWHMRPQGTPSKP